jgi:hypothetical protein
MGTILTDCSHSLSDQPEGFSLVPDYGYCGWLFDPAFQPWLAALNLQIPPVTASSSCCPPDFFLRINLHGRSFSLVIPADLSTCTRMKSFQ